MTDCFRIALHRQSVVDTTIYGNGRVVSCRLTTVLYHADQKQVVVLALLGYNQRVTQLKRALDEPGWTLTNLQFIEDELQAVWDQLTFVSSLKPNSAATVGSKRPSKRTHIVAAIVSMSCLVIVLAAC